MQTILKLKVTFQETKQPIIGNMYCLNHQKTKDKFCSPSLGLIKSYAKNLGESQL